MNPITLNEFGAKLNFVRLAEKVSGGFSDEKELGITLCGVGCVVGTHAGCWVHILSESDTHNALFCRDHCGLRIVIPKEIDTFGKLRQWCEFSIQHPGLSEKTKKEKFLAELGAEKIRKGMPQKELAEIIADAREDCN